MRTPESRECNVVAVFKQLVHASLVIAEDVNRDWLVSVAEHLLEIAVGSFWIPYHVEREVSEQFVAPLIEERAILVQRNVLSRVLRSERSTVEEQFHVGAVRQFREAGSRFSRVGIGDKHGELHTVALASPSLFEFASIARSNCVTSLTLGLHAKKIFVSNLSAMSMT